ncbi:hypothetical protein JKF63_00853 [Porcisia hertigi]|uniref:Rab3-GAP regulatory subunit N-terminal domain-containing protein n=1 Tax=Porcisia hertigi TaxID=2761500 RepID=A0A836KXF8_9TRYP|nr:hypothetical protein JKF63_00853 [Porcisia hertigi]
MRAKNRCILELLQPASPEDSPKRAFAVNIPAGLKSGFRVPRIIQLVAEDEGVIETVSLVREQLDAAVGIAVAEQEDSVAGISTAERVSQRSINNIHVHFFIGTSNGTVLVGNALRGTIVAVAQFQQHHRFDDDRRGALLTTTSTGYTGENNDTTATRWSMSGQRAPANQAVVKFVVRQRSDALLWNPTLPLSQRSTGALSNQGRGGGVSAKNSTTRASPTADSSIESVYVVHRGGKVVELSRPALDVFVRTSIDRLDGNRPHLILEWSPDTSTTSFPVAGPASEFAAHVSCVSILASSPASYSSVESRTASPKAAESATFSIGDADLFSEISRGKASPLLSPLGERSGLSGVLIVGGSNPLFSAFRVEPPPPGLSASNTFKAVKNMVTGVARSLWFTALGTPRAAESPQHLSEVTAPCTHRFLQADAKCTALQVDPTQQWAALAVECGGRIYVVDVQSGLVVAVLKGCRAAQFTWWWTELAGGRSALLLVVYLPLRHALELYTARTWRRLAARHVPEGSVLLRFSGVPREVFDGTPGADGQGRPTRGFDGNGSAPLLMDPSGNVFRISIPWVLENPLASYARLRFLRPAKPTPDADVGSLDGEGSALSRSMLRACQTPDDFLELALRLPLPHPRVQELNTPQSGCIVTGGDEVRTYLAQLATLCETVQCRFAPGYAEIAVAPMPCTPREILDGATTAMPRGVTAAQCIHYVQLYANLVENYHRLLSCKDVAALRYFDPQQWTSALVTPDLWKATFCITAYPVVAAFVKSMDVHVTATLAAHPTELNIYSRHMSAYLQQRMRGSPHSFTAAEVASAHKPAPLPFLAPPSHFISLSAFLRCFYVGSARPTLLRDAIESAEDADGGVTILGPLSDLVFGVWGADSFLTQLPALRDIGCTDGDIAHITVTWMVRQAGRDLAALLSSTTVGCLAATLLSFSDEHFTAALARAPIPFVSVAGELAKGAAVDSVTGLLWCCAVRIVLRRPASSPQCDLLLRRVRQLLQLWHSLSKDSRLPSTSEGTGAAPGGIRSCVSDAPVALFLRLGGVEPSGMLNDKLGMGACNSDKIKSTVAGVGAGPEGDIMEAYLQKNGITSTLLDDFTIPRADADADAARFFPRFLALVSLLGEEGYASDPSTVVVKSLPWIDRNQWDAKRFCDEALQPIEQLWQELRSTFTKDGANASLRSGSGRAVYESCIILVTISVLEHVLRPLTDVSFFFWETNTVPDGNFFPVDGTPSDLMLSSSRASRNYLKSVLQLAALLEHMLLRVVAPLEHAERALVIEQVRLALAADDLLLFPLVSNFFRLRLRIWMQVLAQTPRAPLRRAQRVRRLVELILFFSEVSSSTVGGVPLTQLQSHLTVPWKELLCGSNRRAQLQLLPDGVSAGVTPLASRPAGRQASLVDPPSQTLCLSDPARSPYAAEEEDTHSAPLNVKAAATVLRRFLAASGVLHAQHHARAAITVGPPPCLGIVAEDTRQVLARLAQCLGLQESHPDIAHVVVMDYEIKHLFPVAAVEQEMLLLSTKSAAPQVAATALQSFLVLILHYVTARHKGYGQRGERTAYDVTSEQLRGMTNAVSGELRTWLEECESEMIVAATSESAVNRDADDDRDRRCFTPRSPYITPPGLVFSVPVWVTPAEHREMGRLVSSVLSMRKESPPRKNFFHLLFTLSQWVCEGRRHLPPAAQQIARELPLIVEKWEKLM